jgi:hypothetical protein
MLWGMRHIVAANISAPGSSHLGARAISLTNMSDDHSHELVPNRESALLERTDGKFLIRVHKYSGSGNGWTEIDDMDLEHNLLTCATARQCHLGADGKLFSQGADRR